MPQPSTSAPWGGTSPAVPELGSGALPALECHVWWASPDDAPPGSSSVLDPGERAGMRRLLRAEDRRRYLAAHALLRAVVAHYVDRDASQLRFVTRCARCGGSHGKPRLEEPAAEVEISLSHSGDRVVVAVTAGAPVGVDVEHVDPSADHAGMAQDVLSPAEQGALGALPVGDRGVAFLRYWVRKEAVLKATGEGLSSPPALLTVSPPDRPAALVRWDGRPPADAAVQLHDLGPGPGHLASVAVLSDTPHRVVERNAAVLLCRARGKPS